MPADRAALDPAALRAALTGSFVSSVDVVDVTTSTNADLAAAARDGAPEGTVLVAELQSAGRGRFTRTWTSPRGAGLTFSMVLRPVTVPRGLWGWLPLLTGVALRSAVRPFVPGVDIVLKWPNDLLIGPPAAKVAGVLAEAGAGWVVVGIGLNVDTHAEELPTPHAASLRMFTPDNPIDRGVVLGAVLAEFSRRYQAWTRADGDPERSGLRVAYEAACATLGREIEIHRPDRTDTGRAVRIDDAGALVVETAGGTHTVSAGDIAHIR